MHSNVKRLAVLGAVGATLGIVAPVASASVSPVNKETVVGPAVKGPVVITTARSAFTNVNNQDSKAGNVTGVQVAP
jgi:hypothetical protein